eukprot:TRINITY_DN6096_c1_g1_i1.p1 TRINITY_DN6096_c1_g1~~TRINITY_DN6096_c1_g1_i1.p1  ORF type:complete len:418 (+),score=120.14 TRINITY_DN6096_c1_g1_i1:55-1254(+)
MHAALAVIAASAAATARNMTVYRITPRNYSGVANMDTGDAAGDAFFGLLELSAPLVCANGNNPLNTLCANQPILQIPAFNVYTQFTVEMDDRFGPYAPCNPDSSTGLFTCNHYDAKKGECWWNMTSHPEEFAGVCSRDKCECEALLTEVVGREVVGQGGSAIVQKPPKDWPAQCKGLYYLGAVGVNSSEIVRSFEAEEGDCCDACRATERCTGTTYHVDTGRCDLMRYHFGPNFTVPFFPVKGVRSTFLQAMPPLITNASLHLAKLLQPALWYSTPAAGECADGQQVGDGCYWRIAETVRTVNSSCVNDNMVRVVMRHDPQCFEGCPQPHNRTSECWINCFFGAILGNSTVGGVTRQEIVDEFQGSFANVAEGGCPVVPPCPEPCLPDCWAVPQGSPCR